MSEENKAGCLLGWLQKIIGASSTGKSQAQPPKVMVSKKFITQAEFSFFRVLQQAIGQDAYILMQVSTNQLFYCMAASDRQAWQNRIRAKAIDFLLCHPKTMQPILAIELDDASHQQEKRKKRDEQIDMVFKAANLPILHITAARQYDARSIRQQIKAAIESLQQAEGSTPSPPVPCPRAGEAPTEGR